MLSRQKEIEVHGHRGCRGYMPENTIPAFLKAIDLGVDALELDVVITGDNQVLVSHEAWFSAEICLNLNGSQMSLTDELVHNIFKLPYETIRCYDCGLKPHPRFPEQESIATYKPLLAEVIDTVEAYMLTNSLPPIFYNIEIKSYLGGDGIYHPAPAVFTDLLMQVVQSRGISARTMVQSFDVRPLQELHTRYKEVALGLLVEDMAPVEEHLNKLSFIPDAYNPHFSLLSEELVNYLKAQEIGIFTWTVNTTEIVQKCIDLELDGIITDYPALVRKML